MAGVLYEGQAPYGIPDFYQDLMKDLNKHLESKDIKVILDSLTAIYNEKLKKEKELEKGG